MKISNENYKFLTSIYCKNTFSDIVSKFESFISGIYKQGFIETLPHRSFRLCFNNKNFHWEIKSWCPNLILRQWNSIVLLWIFWIRLMKYRVRSEVNTFVNHCIKNFLNTLFLQRDPNFMVPKRELIHI